MGYDKKQVVGVRGGGRERSGARSPNGILSFLRGGRSGFGPSCDSVLPSFLPPEHGFLEFTKDLNRVFAVALYCDVFL